MSILLKRYLLGFVLAFVGLAGRALHHLGAAWHEPAGAGGILSQAASDAAGLQIEIDHLLIRVKDGQLREQQCPDLAAQRCAIRSTARAMSPTSAIWAPTIQRHSLGRNADSTAGRCRDRQAAAIDAGPAGYAMWWRPTIIRPVRSGPSGCAGAGSGPARAAPDES
jgi:hypothetical protein